MDKTRAIILAGGKGERFGMTKQFIPVNGIPVFIYTLKKFSDYKKCLTLPEEYMDIAKSIIKEHKIKDVRLVRGGETRQESVYFALTAIACSEIDVKNVIITDANRPCISKETIKKCVDGIGEKDALITVCKSVNTVCDIKEEEIDIHPRENQYDMLMPQVFDFKKLFSAHRENAGGDTTDDLQMLTKQYSEVDVKTLEISFWEGLKLTYPADYKIFEVLLKENK